MFFGNFIDQNYLFNSMEPKYSFHVYEYFGLKNYFHSIIIISIHVTNTHLHLGIQLIMLNKY